MKILNCARSYLQKRSIKFPIVGIFLATFVVYFQFTLRGIRPTQDDYAILGQVADYGIWGMLLDSWKNHGGNLFPMFINALSLMPSQKGFEFYGLTILAITTLTLLLFAFQSIFIVFFPSLNFEMGKWKVLGSSAFFILGFESFFTPQLAEILSFSSAVLVHLWPICFFLIGVRIAKKQSLGLSIFLFFLGVIMGNCNVSESIFISITLIILILHTSIEYKFLNWKAQLQVRSLLSLLIGSAIGLALIISAPGFWVRATEQTANRIPESITSISERFFKSLVIFSADFLSHPIFYLCIFLGIFFSRRAKYDSALGSSFRIILIMQSLLFSVLVAGATFAYPAWHQSIGLYLFAPFFGLTLSSFINRKQKAIWDVATFFVFLLVIGINVRGVELLSNRGIQWDLNRHANYCAAFSSPTGEFLGAEIRYKPFALGIEDLSRWEWMANSFRDWVQSDDFISDSTC